MAALNNSISVEAGCDVASNLQGVGRLISNVLFVIAMQTEALPLVNKFQLNQDLESRFPNGVPWIHYRGNYKDLHINIICPGKDAALGTAGGFKHKGACIGDVYIASEVAFHDRRIPIPVRDLYGIGLRQAFPTPNLVKELNLKVGKLSTGDSLDMTPQDETCIIANDATLKDMEGAAVAYVADLLKVPVIFVKAVTDIVDGDKPTAEEFLQNLSVVSVALAQSVVQVIDYINGKRLQDL